jgi:hypothetical protein
MNYIEVLENDSIYIKCIAERNDEECKNFFNYLKKLTLKEIDRRNDIISITFDKENFLEISLNSLLINSLYIRVKFLLDREITLDDLIDFSSHKSPTSLIEDFLNRTLEEYSGENVELLNKLIASLLETQAELTYELNYKYGATVNLYDLCQLYNENEEVKDIINYDINPNKPYAEIEDSVNNAAIRLSDIIKTSIGTNCYKHLIGSVSPKQFTQCMVSLSLKPDIFGKIIPYPINTSLLRGLQEPEHFKIISVGGRKALVVNATYVRTSGYLARKLSLLGVNLSLDTNVEDCNSKDYILITIDSEESLKRLHGRNLYDVVNKQVVKISKHDKHLIGTRIHLRSPITCKLDENKLCKTCIGDIYKFNQFHLSLAGITNLTEQLTQTLLSSKHLMQINAEKIKIPKDFSYYFKLEKDVLVARRPFKFSLSEVQNDDSVDESFITELMVDISSDNTEDDELLISLNGKEMYLDILNEKYNGNIPNEISVLEEEEVFRILIENSEVSTPLKRITLLIENEKLLNNYSVHTLLEEFLILLNKSKNKCSSLTIEFIMRELIRRNENTLERASDLKDYTILRLQNALLENRSLAVGLSFERLKSQLETNIFKKIEHSLLDDIYMR